MRTQRKDVEGFGLAAPSLKGLPDGRCRFIGALTFRVPGRNDNYSILWNTQSNQFAPSPLGITPTGFLPAPYAGRATTCDYVLIAALLEFLCGRAYALAPIQASTTKTSAGNGWLSERKDSPQLHHQATGIARSKATQHEPNDVGHQIARRLIKRILRNHEDIGLGKLVGSDLRADRFPCAANVESF